MSRRSRWKENTPASFIQPANSCLPVADLDSLKLVYHHLFKWLDIVPPQAHTSNVLLPKILHFLLITVSESVLVWSLSISCFHLQTCATWALPGNKMTKSQDYFMFLFICQKWLSQTPEYGAECTSMDSAFFSAFGQLCWLKFWK